MIERLCCQRDEAAASPPWRMALVAVAATAMGLAVQDNGGNISPTAILWLSLSLAAMWGSLLLADKRHPGGPWIVIGACLVVQTAHLMCDPLLSPLSIAVPAIFRGYAFAIAALGILAGVQLAGRAKASSWAFVASLGIALFVGSWIIRKLGVPGIDVMMFQRESWAALFQGYDPYAIRFPDPYDPMRSALFYGPGVSVNGVLQFGYPYMPLTLLMALPGYLLGDVRYASLGAIVLSAALIGYARPSRASRLAASLLLLTPAFPLMLYLGWTESYVLLLVALTWFCHCRRPSLVPYAVGLMLVSKQYMVIGAPVALLLIPRPWSWRALWPFAWRAAVAGGAVTLPLVLWNPQAFMQSAVWLQFRQPFRWDALSYLVWAHPQQPGRWLWLPFAGAAIVWLVVLGRSRRTRISYPLAVALAMAAFFALNKQAFANYYYLVIGVLFAAVAGEEAGEGKVLGAANCMTSAMTEPSRGLVER